MVVRHGWDRGPALLPYLGDNAVHKDQFDYERESAYVRRPQLHPFHALGRDKHLHVPVRPQSPAIPVKGLSPGEHHPPLRESWGTTPNDQPKTRISTTAKAFPPPGSSLAEFVRHRRVPDGTSNTIAFSEWCSNDYSMIQTKRKGVRVDTVTNSSPSALVFDAWFAVLAGLQNCVVASPATVFPALNAEKGAMWSLGQQDFSMMNFIQVPNDTQYPFGTCTILGDGADSSTDDSAFCGPESHHPEQRQHPLLRRQRSRFRQEEQR